MYLKVYSTLGLLASKTAFIYCPFGVDYPAKALIKQSTSNKISISPLLHNGIKCFGGYNRWLAR